MINIIANKTSGKGRGIKNIKKIVEYCSKNGVDYSLHFTHHKGHATEITRSLSQNGGTIVALGGDGTFHEVLNGIVDLENTTLGFIPSGRGNDFARSLGAKLNPIKALEDILRGETKRIDFIEVDEKLRCLNVCGTGLDVEVLKAVEGKTNSISYILGLLNCLRKFDSYKVKIKINGEEKDFDCIMVGACNGKAFGGNILVSPLSEIDDGVMDVIVITMPKNGKVFPIVPKFIKGKHMDMDITSHFKCDEFEVIADYPIELDGEIYSENKLKCKLIKGGLKTFVIK